MIRETSYSQARQRLAMLMDQVTDSREPVLIGRRGKEPVALVAADELAGWIERPTSCARRECAAPPRGERPRRRR